MLTGGLDQQINILRVDTGDYASVHRIRTDGPVLAIAYSANGIINIYFNACIPSTFIHILGK